MSEIKVKLSGLVKEFAGQRGEDAIRAVDDVSLNIYDGEFFALLGPSGCGKTTTLRMIAGFEQPTDGEILIDDQVMNDLPPYHRPVNTVFQDYALFPHMNILQNVIFGLKMEGIPRKEAMKRAEEALEMVQLPHTAKRKPKELSGGQQQRIALARALVKRPKVLLLDEPLGALDLKLRRQMQLELKAMQQQLGITFIFVTHDQEEAMTMANRIAVMEGGKVLQVGRPEEIYENPKTRFVADFIGETNFVEGTLIGQEGEIAHIQLSDSEKSEIKATVGNIDHVSGSKVTVAIRPERIIIRPIESYEDGTETKMTRLSGWVEHVYYIGTDTRYMVKIDDNISLSVRVQNTNPDQTMSFRNEQIVNIFWDHKNARIVAN